MNPGPDGLSVTHGLARLHNPITLRGFTYEDSGRRLIALLDTGSCDDGTCSPRRIVVRHAGQIEFSGLADHERAEIATVLIEHAQRQLQAAA